MGWLKKAVRKVTKSVKVVAKNLSPKKVIKTLGAKFKALANGIVKTVKNFARALIECASLIAFALTNPMQLLNPGFWINLLKASLVICFPMAHDFVEKRVKNLMHSQIIAKLTVKMHKFLSQTWIGWANHILGVFAMIVLTCLTLGIGTPLLLITSPVATISGALAISQTTTWLLVGVSALIFSRVQAKVITPNLAMYAYQYTEQSYLRILEGYRDGIYTLDDMLSWLGYEPDVSGDLLEAATKARDRSMQEFIEANESLSDFGFNFASNLIKYGKYALIGVAGYFGYKLLKETR